MSFYVVLRSTDGSVNYPDNRPHQFRVLLNKTLHLNPQECNVCQPSFVGQSEQSLLRRVVLHHKRSYLDVTFSPVFYLPVAHSECREILVEISDHLGRPADFVKGPVTATLHFKQRPFIL